MRVAPNTKGEFGSETMPAPGAEMSEVADSVLGITDERGLGMLRGFATINYWTDDLAAASAWYAKVLGVEPYFEVPGGYIEFRFGDYSQELGLVNRAYAPEGTSTTPGATAFTRRPRGASSTARARVRAASAPFVAA